MSAIVDRRTRRAALIPLLLPALAALLLRLMIWQILPYRSQISDEAEYLAAASWLAQGRGFSFFKEWIWTRPPVYLIFLAAHIKLFGPENVVPIRISQAVIGSFSVGLVMAWAGLLATPSRHRRVMLLAGWAMALSYSLATFSFLILSETLFIVLLLAGLVLVTAWAAILRQPGSGRRNLALLAAGGVAFGLGALTRALLAGAMPLFAAWVFWQAASRREWRRGLGHAALFTAAVSAVILPWTFYNSRTFGDGLILIDTTGGYNAMLGAQAGHLEQEARLSCAAVTGGQGRPGDGICPAPKDRDEDKIAAALYAIPGQAERQRVAYATALQWIGENPAGFMRKSGRELLDLLMINYGGEERLRSGYTLGEVPIPHLLGLLLDDTLYIIAAPLAVIGLVRRQRRAGKGLALGWLSYNLATGPLFFAINRFRLPLLPILFVYAACALADARMPWSSLLRRRLAISSASAFLLLLLPSYIYWPPSLKGGSLSLLHNTYLGLRSRIIAADCTRGETALERGDIQAAQRFHDRANARMALDCLALLRARILDRSGRSEDALALLQSMRRRPERFLLEGDIYRRLGDTTRAVGAFVAPELEAANLTAWAWQHLVPPRTTRVDLGNGLDWGYVDGFYGREGVAEKPGNLRWSGTQARLRFPGAGSGAAQVLRLRVAAPRPGDVAAPTLTIIQPAECRPGAERCRQQVSEPIGADWQELEVPLQPTPAGEDVVIGLQSPIFVPGPAELALRQRAREKLRLLGVQIDWAELR